MSRATDFGSLANQNVVNQANLVAYIFQGKAGAPLTNDCDAHVQNI